MSNHCTKGVKPMNKGSTGLSGRVATCLAIVLALVGCERWRTSQIVKMVENAGAGDLRTASVGSIVEWFQKHPALVITVDNLCVPVRANALAKWPETTEGRVCNAAAQVAGFIEWQRDIQTNNDHETFQGGSK
jgi:hypothetical protein